MNGTSGFHIEISRWGNRGSVMLARKTPAMALVTIMFVAGCADSLKNRKLPDHPARNLSNVADIRNAGNELQDDYKRLIDVYNADTTNFNIGYILIGTFTAASAIFGAHPDYLKLGGLLAGVTATTQEVLSP